MEEEQSMRLEALERQFRRTVNELQRLPVLLQQRLARATGITDGSGYLIAIEKLYRRAFEIKQEYLRQGGDEHELVELMNPFDVAHEVEALFPDWRVTVPMLNPISGNPAVPMSRGEGRSRRRVLILCDPRGLVLAGPKRLLCQVRASLRERFSMKS
jgi:hypothetical protein